MDSSLVTSESPLTDIALTNNTNISLYPVLVCVCFPIPPINQILILPGDSITSHRLRAQSHKAVLLRPLPAPTSDASAPVLLTYGLWIGGSSGSSLGSTNLLKQLTELRETSYLLNHWLIIKRYQEQTDGKDEQGKVWGNVLELPCPFHAILSLQQYVFTNLKAV